MELGSWSIIQAPSLLALIPLVVYIVLVFRGKNNVSGIIVGIFLAVLMLGQNLKAVSVGLAASLGSSTALIGMIIMAGAGLGVLMSEAGVSRTMVYWIVKRIGVNTRPKPKSRLSFARSSSVAFSARLAAAMQSSPLSLFPLWRPWALLPAS